MLRYLGFGAMWLVVATLGFGLTFLGIWYFSPLPGGLRVPRVVFEQSTLTDRLCLSETSEARARWQEELKVQLPALQKLWLRDGAPLLESAVQVVGQGYSDGRIDLSLSYCSSPFTLGLKRYLTHIHPKPMNLWVSEVLEEVLRPQVYRLLRPSLVTPLIREHLGEGWGVVRNLHVFALVWEVHRRLDREDLLPLSAVKRSNLSTNKRRAWEILEQAGGPEQFIRELGNR